MNNNVNIEQGQLNFDWFTQYCVVTKRFDWLKEEGTVFESGTRPLDYGFRDPVPDPEPHL